MRKPSFLPALSLIAAIGCSTKDAPTDSQVCEFNETEDSGTSEVTPDSGTPDTGSTDTGTPDTGTTDTGDIPVELPEVDQNESPWPTEVDAVGANFASALMDIVSNFEISGVVHHDERSSLFITDDNGGLAEIQLPYGQVQNYWPLTGDLEGITIGPEARLFLANETSRGDFPGKSILSFNLETEELNLECTLSDLPTNDGNSGLEALTYVPFQYAPEEWGSDEQGFFVAGTQYVNELSIYAASACANGEEITRNYGFEVSHTDVAGLAFNTTTQRMYVLYDSANNFDVYKNTGERVAQYTLQSDGPNPWDQQEGIDIFNVECGEDYENYSNAKATLSIAEDLGALYLWDSFPVSCQPPPQEEE